MKELLLNIHKRAIEGWKRRGFFGHNGRKGKVGGSASTSNALSKPLNHQQVVEILKDEAIVKEFGNYSSVFKKLSLNNNGVVARINRVIEGGQGVFKSQEDRDRAEELLEKFEKEAIDNPEVYELKEYKDIKRAIEQDNYLAALYELAEEKFGDKADSNNKREKLTLEQEKLLEEVDKIEYQYYGDEGDIKKEPPMNNDIDNKANNSLDNKPEDNIDNDSDSDDSDNDILQLIREANNK